MAGSGALVSGWIFMFVMLHYPKATRGEFPSLINDLFPWYYEEKLTENSMDLAIQTGPIDSADIGINPGTHLYIQLVYVTQQIRYLSDHVSIPIPIQFFWLRRNASRTWRKSNAHFKKPDTCCSSATTPRICSRQFDIEHTTRQPVDKL